MLIKTFLENLNFFTVLFAIIVACIAFFIPVPNNKARDLEFILNRSLAGASIPTGLGLLTCALAPEHLELLKDVNLNIAIAGIAILFISIKGIIKP